MKKMFRCMVAGLPLLLSAAVVEDVQVPSPSMNKDVPASVVLPEKYAQDPGAAWPVVYVVHGAGGNHRTYATNELTYLADQYGFIFVCADGGKTSWWFDSPIDPTYKYETHVTKELVPWIDVHYRTYATRTQRAIMGGSMGGHGACWLGFRHKDLFGAVGSIYGGLDLWEFHKQWDIAKRLGPRDEFPERWRTYSAYTEGAKLKNGDVEFIQMVGTSDFFLKANRKMHEILVSNKVEHTYIEMRTDQEKTSGHSGEFNALCKPIFASFFRNYFDTGKGQIAQGFHARTTRYGVKVAKKVRGMTARPQVELPAPWKIVEGDEGLTGCDVRDFYFTIEAPGENTPAPAVKLVWPGVAVNGVYGARDVTIADEAVSFTPTARKAPLTYATGWQEGALSMLYHHHVEGAQHGPYAGRPLPMNEIRAGDNWRAAARAMFARAGLGETNATDGALIRLYGFDSNFPNRHVDHPPHFHVMLEWNGFRNNNVGHYVLDPDGRIRVNNFLVCGRVPGYDREGYFKQARGETTAYNGPSGRTVFTLEMLKDGSGLILRRPGQVREWMISGENPVEAVTVSARVSPYAPWTEVASYSVADDTVAGVLQITERTATAAKTERFVYHPDTGKLIRRTKDSSPAMCAAFPSQAETWRMTELEFAASTNYDAGGGDAVGLDAVFSNRLTGAMIRRPGFWDGGNRFLVRFAPTAPGEWDWTTSSEDAGLNGRKGTLAVIPYTGKQDIYRHGFLKVVPGKKYFVHADGTPFFYLGDTHWGLYKEEIDEPGPHAGSTGATSHFKYIVDRRVEQGFTVYQSEPIGAKFKLEDGHVDAADIPGLRLADRYYRHIADAGLVHANASFFFAAGMNEKLAKDEATLARISRYWVARFGAYPVLWTLAQEIDNDFYSERGAHPFYNYSNNPWVKVAAFMHREDAYSHPLSGHQENTGATTVTGRGTNPDKTKISGNGVSVFADAAVSARTGHNWWAAQWSPSLTGRMDVQIPSDYWNSSKPAVNYEGRYCGLWTKDTGARAQGWLAFLSGFCGYGYGAIDMWLYQSTYDIKKTSADGVDVITPEDKMQPWSKSIEYPSALQMAHLKKFLLSFDWWNLKPDLEGDSQYDGSRAIGVHAVAGRRHVFYFYGKGRESGSMKGFAAKAGLTLRWFNPRTGEWLPSQTVSAGEDGGFALPPRPDEQDWALELAPSGQIGK